MVKTYKSISKEGYLHFHVGYIGSNTFDSCVGRLNNSHKALLRKSVALSLHNVLDRHLIENEKPMTTCLF
jgi:hypothetical protein